MQQRERERERDSRVFPKFRPAVFFSTKMQHFAGLTAFKIGQRYGNDEMLLVTHLMETGLLDSAAPSCHGIMVLQPSRPWHWRCSERACSKTRSVLDSDSLLSGNYKNLQVFLAAYLWATE